VEHLGGWARHWFLGPVFWFFPIALSLAELAAFGQPIQDWQTRVIPLPHEEIL